MKEFNKELNEDIELLKALHAQKDKSSFNDLKAEIMFKHKISKATVYREMKKDRPGSYKKPSYWPPAMDIRMPEILMVRELLLSGRQGTEIIKIMSKELGINYYWDRFDRARALGEELPEEEYDPKQTAFARNGRMFLMELFNLPYMAPGNHDIVSVNGWDLKVSRETYDIMILQLMKDNEPGKADDSLVAMRDEVIAFYQLKASTLYSISELSRSNVPGSGHALKCYREQLEKIKMEEKIIIEKKKYLLHQAKIGMAYEFYKEEWMNNPSEYDPIHNNYDKDEAADNERLRNILNNNKGE